MILEKSWKKLKVRFPHSKMAKIWDFLTLGQTPPRETRLDFFGWKLLGCRCFDVWVVFGWFLLDFDTPPPAWSTFYRAMHCDSGHFWGERMGQRPLGGSLPTFVDWKRLWYPSLWCLEGFWVGFWSFETTFFWSPFIVYMYVWRFEIFLRELLDGNNSPAELDLELREYSGLALFC